MKSEQECVLAACAALQHWSRGDRESAIKVIEPFVADPAELGALLGQLLTLAEQLVKLVASLSHKDPEQLIQSLVLEAARHDSVGGTP